MIELSSEDVILVIIYFYFILQFNKVRLSEAFYEAGYTEIKRKIMITKIQRMRIDLTSATRSTEEKRSFTGIQNKDTQLSLIPKLTI